MLLSGQVLLHTDDDDHRHYWIWLMVFAVCIASTYYFTCFCCPTATTQPQDQVVVPQLLLVCGVCILYVQCEHVAECWQYYYYYLLTLGNLAGFYIYTPGRYEFYHDFGAPIISNYGRYTLGSNYVHRSIRYKTSLRVQPLDKIFIFYDIFIKIFDT